MAPRSTPFQFDRIVPYHVVSYRTYPFREYASRRVKVVVCRVSKKQIQFNGCRCSLHVHDAPRAFANIMLHFSNEVNVSTFFIVFFSFFSFLFFFEGG